MKDDSINEFFAALGEIWRDITAIEFLMRCALAQQAGDVDKLPKPPYERGRIYQECPTSFLLYSFGDVAEEFNKEFPKLAIPKELVDLRNAMAHGLVSEIGERGVDELVKFKKQKNGSVMVEFGMSLELPRLRQIRQSLMELRRHIAREAADKPKGQNPS